MQKHVGQFNLFEWLKRMTQRTIDRFAVDKLLADSLVEVPLPASLPEFETKEHAQSEANSWNIPGESATDYLIASIYAGTAERYYPDLAHQFHSYAHEVGRNYWALAQAVSDIATHRMQQTAGGDSRENFNWSADQWASRQLARISKVAGIR
jgi:hypothetical protein